MIEDCRDENWKGVGGSRTREFFKTIANKLDKLDTRDCTDGSMSGRIWTTCATTSSAVICSQLSIARTDFWIIVRQNDGHLAFTVRI